MEIALRRQQAIPPYRQNQGNLLEPKKMKFNVIFWAGETLITIIFNYTPTS